jgi:hypothetical protein
MRRSAGAVLGVVGLALGCAALPPWPFGAGTVEGRVLDAGGAQPWVVVYLEGAEGPVGRRRPPAASLRREPEGFSPPVLAVAAGQPVELAGADGIHHRFFSSSRPNDFELPTLASAEARRVAFEQPGVVRVYCSLHPGERGTVFVAPSPHFAALRAPGPWAIRGVPPGRYALRTWSEAPTPPERSVTVRRGARAFVELAVGSGETRP